MKSRSVVHHPGRDGTAFSTVEDEIESLRALVEQLTATGLVQSPVGRVVDYAGTAAPDGWLLCFGQSLLRADYPDLFTAIGTTFGAADASHFSLPDCRGRVIAGKDDMGGTSANRLTNQTGGLNGDVLGATGGAETHTLTTAQIPELSGSGTAASGGGHTPTLTGNDADVNGGLLFADNTAGGGSLVAGGIIKATGSLSVDAVSAHTHTVSVTVNAGSATVHNNVQPTMVFNKIIYHGVVS